MDLQSRTVLLIRTQASHITILNWTPAEVALVPPLDSLPGVIVCPVLEWKMNSMFSLPAFNMSSAILRLYLLNLLILLEALYILFMLKIHSASSFHLIS